jgi:hypothetical protein
LIIPSIAARKIVSLDLLRYSCTRLSDNRYSQLATDGSQLLRPAGAGLYVYPKTKRFARVRSPASDEFSLGTIGRNIGGLSIPTRRLHAQDEL